MKKIYFGRDENDVIKIDAGGTVERTAACDVTMRPLFLRCSVGAWPVASIGFTAQSLTVLSFRIGRDEQLMEPVPLAVLLDSAGVPLTLDTILPGALVYIKIESSAKKDRLECTLWLEGEEIDLVKERMAIVGEMRSPQDQVLHLEHQLQKAHTQRDVAIEALKRIAGPDGASSARWSQEIAKEALKDIHALRRPIAAKRRK